MSLREAAGPLYDLLGCPDSSRAGICVLLQGGGQRQAKRKNKGRQQGQQQAGAQQQGGRRSAAGPRAGGQLVAGPVAARAPAGYPPQRLQPPPGPSAGAGPQQGQSQGQQPVLSGQQRAQQAAERAVRGTGNRQQPPPEAPSQSSGEPGNGDGPPPGGEPSACVAAWLLVRALRCWCATAPATGREPPAAIGPGSTGCWHASTRLVLWTVTRSAAVCGLLVLWMFIMAAAPCCLLLVCECLACRGNLLQSVAAQSTCATRCMVLCFELLLASFSISRAWLSVLLMFVGSMKLMLRDACRLPIKRQQPPT